MASIPLVCALLASKYSVILDALYGELGDAAVVRVGPADAEEPYPPRVLGPDELPGPPPARYVIECVLPAGSPRVRAAEGGAAGGGTECVDRGDLVAPWRLHFRPGGHRYQ